MCRCRPIGFLRHSCVNAHVTFAPSGQDVGSLVFDRAYCVPLGTPHFRISFSIDMQDLEPIIIVSDDFQEIYSENNVPRTFGILYNQPNSEEPMANTYTQIHIQCVFAVKFRQSVIRQEWKERLHKYITGIVQNHDHKMIAINSMPDHLHLFMGFRPTQSLSDLMKMVKGDSSEWINEQKFNGSKFNWQDGFGAFSYSRSQLNAVALYIENQEQHHRKKTFLEEYKDFLDRFEVEYDKRYIFKDLV